VTQRKSPDDIVVVSALRTPITRAKKGGLKDTPADDLVATLLKATVDRTGLDVSDVGDVVVGSVLGNSSQRANECRIAMFLAGFPQEVPVRTVNRQCSSGLQACADVAGEYFFVLYLFAYTNFFVLQPPSKLGTTTWASPPAWRR
jgi:acetyl-CoA acetyltransferase